MVSKSLDIACTWSRFLEGNHQKPGGGCGKVVFVRNPSLPSPFLSGVSLIAGMEYGMEWWNGKWNGMVNVRSYT